MIETDRLILRRETAQDHDAITALWADTRVTHFIGGTPQSAEQSWQRLLRHAGHWALFDYGIFAAINRETGQFVGEVGLAHFKRGLGDEFDNSPEAAWVIHPDFHGKGFAVEAMQAAQHWFDATHGTGRSVCIIDPDNIPSVRLAERLGYRPFDTRRYHDKPVTLFERVVR
ncbi:GNAT family N-acetyltransferase [Stakelama sediminis]|uniref:RimJ/RimL family protein N-acetyltransferase n=1 Tax=Stakelama sediminis TaxID=463200 RepID=A0A840Z249_9SPHN|nr:GNAT family N-acetyltransferase [Stakelama sediminis]MBB5719837.1 RimJ/RimL family protein N-acetyltransferase [Stakelama sediminis]